MIETTKIPIGNQFYIERIEHLSKKEKKHILNALSIYCNKMHYTQAIIEHLYNSGRSGAITLRIKVQEEEGIHIGVFKIDYYKNIIREKESFDKIRATGGSGSSLFLNIESVNYNKNELEECNYKAVIEYTAADGLSETITDLRSLVYKYYAESSTDKFAQDLSRIIHNIFVSNFGLNGVLYSNQKYSNKYYDIHFDRELQRPPREVFGAEWPPDVLLQEVKLIDEEQITPSTEFLFFKESININKQMLSALKKGEKYLFRLDFIKYDVSDTKKIKEDYQRKRLKFIIPGKYRVDIEIDLSNDEIQNFFDYIESVNIIYIEGIYTKNKIDILEEEVKKLNIDTTINESVFTKNIKFPNIIRKIETFLDNPLLKVFMECLSFNDPNFNNILISENQVVKIIDYALISQNGLYYDLSRFEVILKMEFIFDVLYPKYNYNEDLFYKTILMVEDWALFEKEVEDIDNVDKDIKFLYIFTILIRYYMVELADMHYLHTFNEFKSGSFLREYIYSLMFFNISFLKFKHDPPERKKLAFMLASYYMQKLEKNSFVSSAQLNDKIFRIKKAFAEILSNESKNKQIIDKKDYNPNKLSIETLLNIINSSEEEQIDFFEKIYKLKSANKLFDDFLENYFYDYKTQLTKLFISISRKKKSNSEMLSWILEKMNILPIDEEALKFDIIENCCDSTDDEIKLKIISLLYTLSQYNLRKAISIVLKITKGLVSRTLIFISFLLRCKTNKEHYLVLQILAEVLKEEIPLSLKFNILEYLKKHYKSNKEKTNEIIKYLSKEKNLRLKAELTTFLENINKQN